MDGPKPASRELEFEPKVNWVIEITQFLKLPSILMFFKIPVTSAFYSEIPLSSFLNF
jgi:hypothetical protein